MKSRFCGKVASLPLKLITLATANASAVWRFHGERGDFALLQGEMDTLVLRWLREGFVESVDQSSWSFDAIQDLGDRKTENGCKLEIMGQLLSPTKLKRSLFSLKAGGPHYDRWQAWRLAFVTCNADALKQVESHIRLKLAAGFAADECGKNGGYFLRTPIEEWFWAFGCCQLMKGEPQGYMQTI